MSGSRPFTAFRGHFFQPSLQGTKELSGAHPGCAGVGPAGQSFSWGEGPLGCRTCHLGRLNAEEPDVDLHSAMPLECGIHHWGGETQGMADHISLCQNCVCYTLREAPKHYVGEHSLGWGRPKLGFPDSWTSSYCLNTTQKSQE